MDCSICCEKLNLSTRAKVSCNYCDLECCRKCIQKYLTEITTDPHCMKCKNIWNREFIDSTCTKHFRNENLKIHRENILFEREKSFLPDAQIILAHRKECNRLVSENNEKIKELRIELFRLENENDNIRNKSRDIPHEKRKFIRKCPVADCRGFLSSQWKCEVCENKICHECNEVKIDDIDHICDPANVETMKLLKKDTKPCPNCGTMIFKISGCAQMWCPDCHTAFNWNTLQIEKGVIHNPHFFDFQRLGGAVRRNPGDILCGGIPHVNELYTACKMKMDHRRHYQTIPLEYKIIFDFCNMIQHVEHVEINNIVPIENNLELRIKYLVNEMSEKEFKFILQKNEKSLEKQRDINNILTMIVHTGSDILRQFVNREMKLEEIKDIILNLIRYTNDTLKVISHRYACVVPRIGEDTLTLIRLRYYK